MAMILGLSEEIFFCNALNRIKEDDKYDYF